MIVDSMVHPEVRQLSIDISTNIDTLGRWPSRPCLSSRSQLDADCCAPLGADALDAASAERLAQAFKALGRPGSAAAAEHHRFRPDRRGLRL